MADVFDKINEAPVDGDGQGTPADGQSPLPEGQGGDSRQGAPNPEDGQGGGDASNVTSTEGNEDWSQEFASPEEMYRAYRTTKQSYDHLRPKLTETTTKLSQMLNQQNAGAQQNQQPARQQNLSPEEATINAVRDLIAPIQQNQAQLAMQNTLNRLAAENPDFTDVLPDLMDVLEQNPELWHTKAPVDLAFQIAKTRKMPSTVQKVAKDARDAAYQDRELKEVASSGRTNGSQMGGNAKSPEDAILEEIRAAQGANKNVFI